MAKLHFRYSVMNAGKSTALLSIRHNYVENGDDVVLLTSAVDDRHGVGKITSRLGIEAEAHALGPDENAFDFVARIVEERAVAAVLVDEVQFLTKEQVYQLSEIVDQLDIPVMAWGLKNNFQGDLFSPAVMAMLALANDIEEVKQVCHCGRKATMILKYNPDGSVERGGDVVETGAESRYISVCREHWKAGNLGKRVQKAIFEAGHGPRVVCATCGSQHQPIFDDPEQAYRCAALLRGREISGYYGSTVADGTVFKFSNDIPSDARQGVICDDCIERYRKAGELEEKNYAFAGDEDE